MSLSITVHRKGIEYEMLVDEADRAVAELCTWSVANNGYAQGTLARKVVHLHRLLLPRRPGLYVDHINGNKLDNRRENLRYATPKENARNRRKCTKRRFTSKWFGVCWDSSRNKWLSQANNRKIGRFDNEEDAAQAYNFAVYRLYGDFAVYNEAPQTFDWKL